MMEAATLKHDNQQKSNPTKDGSFFKPVIQTKLSINEPGDRYEREADAMADKVMRMADPSTGQNAFFKSAYHTVQRKCAACEEEGKHIHRKENASVENQLQLSDSIASLNTFFKPVNNTVQRKCQACEEEEKHVHRKESSTGEMQVSGELQNYVSSLSSSGQQMAETSRGFFESRFGHDFSGVKIHTDTVAAKSAQSINALAYTTGNNIVFNSGQYAPESDSGKRLIAHELTHVLQQGGGVSPKVQRMGDLTKVPPMACTVANSSPPPSVLSSLFPLSSFTLTAAQRTNIANFVASWRASGGTDQLRVDGFASTPGTDEMNWQLSCNRALSVANELRNDGVPDSSITIFAQGETSEFGAQANNQTANISMIGTVTPPTPPVPPTPAPPAPAPVITSETVVTSPGARTRTTVGVGEEIHLTLSTGTATTAWTATAGNFIPPAATGATVLYAAPDTAQNVTITAGGATIVFSIIAPNDVHMDPFPGTGVKHTVNLADSGIETQPFILPDNVNFNKVIYREQDVVGVPTTPGVYSCNPFAGGHCPPAGIVPCQDLALTSTVVAGKGTQSVLGDCAYSGHCGNVPLVPGSVSLSIPYEYKVGATGTFHAIRNITQIHALAADRATLTTDKAGAHGNTTVTTASSAIAACP